MRSKVILNKKEDSNFEDSRQQQINKLRDYRLYSKNSERSRENENIFYKSSDLPCIEPSALTFIKNNIYTPTNMTKDKKSITTHYFMGNCDKIVNQTNLFKELRSMIIRKNSRSTTGHYFQTKFKNNHIFIYPSNKNKNKSLSTHIQANINPNCAKIKEEGKYEEGNFKHTKQNHKNSACSLHHRKMNSIQLKGTLEIRRKENIPRNLHIKKQFCLEENICHDHPNKYARKPLKIKFKQERKDCRESLLQGWQINESSY